ncbi:MAG TPA: vitamin K epoxide reductase family protein, partial [Thermoanaerobaculia bacterium]|nr:vitamin K epoxide reductase family protein [Thermoanaerobaculia bacterium]
MRRDSAPAWAVFLLILLAVAGAGISLMLTSYHLSQGRDAAGIFQKVCGADGGGCREVLSSGWAVLPQGIPLSALGLVYFGGLAVWYLVVGPANRRGRYWQSVPLLIHVLGALASAFLLAVMVTQVGALCWWCTITHLINFAMLYLAWKMWPSKDSGYTSDPVHPGLRLGIAGLLLLVAVAGITYEWVRTKQMRGVAEQADRYARGLLEDADLQRYLHLRQRPLPLPVRPGDPVRGSVGAPHTVVVFSDFQCPACLSFAEFSERQLLPRFGSRLRVVYKHFPLEPECNSGVSQTVHPQACQAAFAAEAAHELGGNEGFWRMHDLLFARQGGLAEEPWEELGRNAGFDGAAVAQRVAQGTARNRIAQDAELGLRARLSGTPGVFLDGRPVGDWSRMDVWETLLESAP